MTGRTIVVSDLHGCTELLHNALEHAGFEGDGRLVVAGDLIDRGPDDCVAEAEHSGATILPATTRSAPPWATHLSRTTPMPPRGATGSSSASAPASGPSISSSATG